MKSWLLYGANGYTGKLIAEEAKKRGMSPILAGRNEEAIRLIASNFGFPYRIFDLSQPEIIRNNIRGVTVVLNCSGPFSYTCKPILHACLDESAHYLDISGDIPLLEYIYSLDDLAKERGCALLPGVGFDVVPTDCLALSLKEALPSATHLRLAFATKLKQSPGTWKTTIDVMPRGGLIRRDGKLVRVPHAWKAGRIDFDNGNRWTMTLPWGDLASAYKTTGIPNIEIATATPLPLILAMKLIRPIAALPDIRWIKRFAFRLVDLLAKGPTERDRITNTIHLRGDAWDDKGARKSARYTVPDGYLCTVLTSIECVQRVLDGAVPPGAWTPAGAFGDGFIAEFPGVKAEVF